MLTAEQVKSLAREVGFDLCGITGPEPIPEAGERFVSWLDRGYHGEMAYLARDPERRTDPRQSLPEVRSIIMLGLNYYQRNTPKIPEGHGRVSRYARGRDYHKVAEGLLKSLAARLQEAAGEDQRPTFKWFVDYGPFLERAYAERAGLGYIGRNSMLINKRFGSWIFLSEILTDVDLERDDPNAVFHGGCGDCRACIDVCPTGAIVGDADIDARKCISYLTIERPSSVPAEHGKKMGPLIFGCDMCQQVCPHNRKAKVTERADFKPDRGVGEFLEAARILRMSTRDEYLELAAGTPLTRPGLDNLKRNAEIVLDNERHRKTW